MQTVIPGVFQDYCYGTITHARHEVTEAPRHSTSSRVVDYRTSACRARNCKQSYTQVRVTAPADGGTNGPPWLDKGHRLANTTARLEIEIPARDERWMGTLGA